MTVTHVYRSQTAEERRARLAAIHRKCLLLLRRSVG